MKKNKITNTENEKGNPNLNPYIYGLNHILAMEPKLGIKRRY